MAFDLAKRLASSTTLLQGQWPLLAGSDTQELGALLLRRKLPEALNRYNMLQYTLYKLYVQVNLILIAILYTLSVSV